MDKSTQHVSAGNPAPFAAVNHQGEPFAEALVVIGLAGFVIFSALAMVVSFIP